MSLNNFDYIFSDGELERYIESKLYDAWANTKFKGYVYLGPKQKGSFGEAFVERYMLNRGHTVNKRKNPGHDRLIDDVKTEIKFGLCVTKDKKLLPDSFILNHISKDKDWERLLFFGINSLDGDFICLWFNKNDFVNYLNENNCLFKHQQGGDSIGNDDYICTKINDLKELSFVKDISEWKRKPNLIDFML